MSAYAFPAVQGSLPVRGVDIHYEYFGERNRPVMVVFNGVAMNTVSWHRLLPPVLENMDVLLWDYRGQGLSTSDDNPYSVEELADCAIALCDALAVAAENVNLLGVSTGSIVAAETLRRHHGRIKRAVLSGILLEPAMSFRLDSYFSMRLLREKRVDLWAEQLYTRILSDSFLVRNGPTIPVMQAALVERYRDKPHALARIIEAQSRYLWESEQYRDDFENVETPILVLAGAQDKLVPPFYQKNACAMFPNARYRQYADCAHIPFIENTAKAFRECVKFFLAP